MIIRSKPQLTENDVTPEPIYRNRREFLRHAWGAGALTMLSAGGAGCSNNSPSSSETEPVAASIRPLSDLKTSEFNTDEKPTAKNLVTHYINFYEFGSDKTSPAQKAQAMAIDPWSVEVAGECHKPGRYTLEAILKPHDLEERIYRFRCVEAWSAVIPWVGFPLGALLKRFEPTGNAKYVQFFTLVDPKVMPNVSTNLLDWPYREGLRLDEAMHPLALAGVGMYGHTLPKQNGAPLRLVVPWKYGFKSIKSLVKIVFTETQPKTSWNMAAPHEYGFYANVNPDVPHPRWSQAREQRLGDPFNRETKKFNGYGDQVASLYSGMDLTKFY